MKPLATKRGLIMKSKIEFSPFTIEQKEQLNNDLKSVMTESEWDDFVKWVKPYNEFSYNQLDDIYLVVEVTIEGNGVIKKITPDCIVDQENWQNYEDEPDIRIDPVYIPLRLVFPKTPLEIIGSKRFLAVLVSENNICDQCKNLPKWVWDDCKFEIMLRLNITSEDGTEYNGFEFSRQASKLITF